jgi:DNA ligase (NAD+)
MAHKLSDDIIKKLMDDAYNYSRKLKIKELEDLLRTLSLEYHSEGSSLVPDAVYDLIKYVLVSKDQNNKFLKEVGSPVLKNKVKLPYFMASLDKIVPDTNYLSKWKTKYKKLYVISDKLDGVSAMLKYENKVLSMYTRGDGESGTDITFLIPYVISKDIKLNKLPDKFIVRGELIISKDDFKSLDGKYANARNTVSGLVNSKTYSKRLNVAHKTKFIAYQVIYPRYNQYIQMKELQKYNFPTVTYKIMKETELINETLSKYLLERREKSAHEIDGIVVVHSDDTYEIPKENPKHAFAFKQVMDDQFGETTVLDVKWTISKDGYLKPTVHVEPIKLVGTTIKKVYAHNAKYIVDNKIGPGSQVQVIRSKDVIPQIHKVMTESANGIGKMPTKEYDWNATEIDIKLKTNVTDDEYIAKNITHFFKVLKVKHISSGIVAKLVKNGYKTVVDIIAIDIEKAAEIEGIGKIVMEKIKNNIQEALQNTSLAKFMSASNCFGMGLGSRKLKIIVDEYPDILTMVTDDLLAKLVELDGFDTKTANKFNDNLDKFKTFYNNVNEVYSIEHIVKNKKKKKVKKGKFTNKKIVFTGFRDETLEALIEKEGGNISSTVSSNTYILVHNGDTSLSKYEKAKLLKITIMTKAEFKKKYVKINKKTNKKTI